MWEDDECDYDLEEVKCRGLYSIADLQRACQKENLKFSPETNRYLMYLTLKKLGPILSQKLIKRLVEAGELEWNKGNDFEVETILDHEKDEDGIDYYNIKWKGWSLKHNTWEPLHNLDCTELLEEFHTQEVLCKSKPELQRKMLDVAETMTTHKDKIDQLFSRISVSPDKMTPLKLLEMQSPAKRQASSRLKNSTVAKKRKAVGDITNKRSMAYKKLKKEVHVALDQWEKELNAINSDPAPLVVENEVDLEGPPDNFTYINDYKEGPGISIPQDPIIGCECQGCLEEKKNCCGPNAGAEFAYYKNRRVRLPPQSAIYECNKRCKCGPDCPNRVVQKGRRHRVAIFRTANGRGWGVKAMQKIKQGSFVVEYVGEVISNEEAERRGREYDIEGRTYLFDLDFNDDQCPFTVDAGFYGNVSHFINHSCDPNLAVYGVWINTLDPRLPRIALFAIRDIEKGEELTFDYMMTGDTTHQMKIQEQLANEASTNPPPEGTTENNGETPTTAKTEDITNTADSAQQDVTNVLSDTTNLHRDHKTDSVVAIGNITPESDINTRESDMDIDTEIQFNTPPGSEVDSLAGSLTLSGEPAEKVGEAALPANGAHAMDMDSIATQMPPPPPPVASPSRKITSPSPAMKYRIMCQCGAKNCRKYLF